MLKKLLSVRISYIGMILLFFFLGLVLLREPMKLSPGQLALFSVNSFLFGYYFGPLLSAQKGRVASLIATARTEETTILDILSQAHLLTRSKRHGLKIRLKVYLDSIIGNEQLQADNPYYDELLYYTKNDKTEDNQVMGMIYDRVAKTQANRDTLNNLFATKVYSHEWLVVMVLYAVTLFFALQIDISGSLLFAVLLAVLCTGLSLLMVILVKFGTLTHKEAQRMWVPLRALVVKHFDDIDPKEVAMEKKRVDDYVRQKHTTH
jgi:hypothetical protein